MNGPGNYESAIDLLNGVTRFVSSFIKEGNLSGFKIEVYAGRGVHEFKLVKSEESKAAEKIATLKKKLAAAEKSLAEERKKKRARRSRPIVESLDDDDDSWPPYDGDNCDFTPPDISEN